MRLRQHPRGLWFVLWGELAERASFYGMRTLLVLYVIDVLGFSQAGGATVMKVFMAVCFVTPFLGGWIADRHLGSYRTILYFSVPYILGHIVLGLVQNATGLFIALGLLSLGAGALKPNASVLLARIYEAQNKSALLNEAFSVFYAVGNMGGVAAAVTLPLVVTAQHGRYGLALAMPAALMAIAFVAFAIGKRWYPDERVQVSRPSESPRARPIERRTLLYIAGVFGCVSIFWLVYGQNADTWVYFAHSHSDLHLFGDVHITANQTQALNPLLIIVLTPVFNWIWNARRKQRGAEVPETRKMLFGYAVVVIASGIMTYSGWLARGETVTVWWIIIATALMALAELCIAPVGLIFAYRHAGTGTKSVLVAVFNMMTFVGSLIGLIFAPFYENGLDPAVYFALLAIIMAAMTVAFVPITRLGPDHKIDSRLSK